MDEESLFRYTTRGLLQFANYVLAQLPQTNRARLDARQFIRSMTFAKGGSRYATSDWELGPGWFSQDDMATDDLGLSSLQEVGPDDGDDFLASAKRIEGLRQWTSHQAKFVSLIPFKALQAKAEENTTSPSPSSKISPFYRNTSST